MGVVSVSILINKVEVCENTWQKSFNIGSMYISLSYVKIYCSRPQSIQALLAVDRGLLFRIPLIIPLEVIVSLMWPKSKLECVPEPCCVPVGAGCHDGQTTHGTLSSHNIHCIEMRALRNEPKSTLNTSYIGKCISKQNTRFSIPQCLWNQDN